MATIVPTVRNDSFTISSLPASWVDQRRNGRVVIPTFASILSFANVVSVHGTVYVRLMIPSL